MALGNKILEYRKRNGLSQEQLADKINVTRQTISNWELGETQPNSEQLKMLSKEFSISIDELLDNDIKNISLSKTNVQKHYKSKYLKIFLICIVIIILGIFILYINKNNFKRKDKIIDKTIICNLYGEDHIFNIKYYEADGKIKELGKDLYFKDILELDKYDDVNQILNIINDYVKKNGGTCTIVKDRELDELVNISIKEGTLTKTGATIIITDNNPNKIIYGTSFYIEKYENSDWHEVMPINNNYGFNDMAYYVDENGKLELEQNWEYIYGKLNKGIYRIVKDVAFESDVPITPEDIYYIWTEFEIQ